MNLAEMEREREIVPLMFIDQYADREAQGLSLLGGHLPPTVAAAATIFLHTPIEIGLANGLDGPSGRA